MSTGMQQSNNAHQVLEDDDDTILKFWEENKFKTHFFQFSGNLE